MKIKHLKVFGVTVPVKEEKGLLAERGLAAYYHVEKKYIAIDPSIKGEERDATLLHELFHSMFFRLGFEQVRMSHDAHELLAENFSRILVENFRITPKKA